MTLKFKLKNGTEIHVAEYGEGRPLIFLHGVMMSSRFFHDQIAPLSKNHRVILIDFPGHGKSTDIHKEHTVAAYADAVHQYITAKNIKDAALIGWSMGVFVMWEYMQTFGTKNLAGSVVIDELESDFKWPDYEYGALDLNEMAGFIGAMQMDYPAVSAMLMDMMFSTKPDPKTHNDLAQEILKVHPTTAACIFFDQTMRDYRAFIPSIDIPTWIAVGRDETIVPVAAAQAIQNKMTGASLTIFEQSGHCPFIEEPDNFNAALLEFLQSLT